MDQSRRVNWILTAVLVNKVSKVDEKVCCLRHSVVWPGGEMELTHCVALWCVGLEEYTLKKIKEKTDFRGAPVRLPAIYTGQSSASLKMLVINCAVI